MNTFSVFPNIKKFSQGFNTASTSSSNLKSPLDPKNGLLDGSIEHFLPGNIDLPIPEINIDFTTGIEPGSLLPPGCHLDKVSDLNSKKKLCFT